MAQVAGQRYRADGVRITHDPYAPGMAEKYGQPGETDNEGFDPYADSVGPGIYSGIVARDEQGQIVVGTQYQNHNPRPGPVYAGGGYTPVSKALRSPEALAALLDRFPDLVNDVATGGAQPLHSCGMSRAHEPQTSLLISRGADIEALDTYGFTPLMRMASNNLAEGALALLAAGADPARRVGGRSGDTVRVRACVLVTACLRVYLRRSRRAPEFRRFSERGRVIVLVVRRRRRSRSRSRRRRAT